MLYQQMLCWTNESRAPWHDFTWINNPKHSTTITLETKIRSSYINWALNFHQGWTATIEVYPNSTETASGIWNKFKNTGTTTWSRQKATSMYSKMYGLYIYIHIFIVTTKYHNHNSVGFWKACCSNEICPFISKLYIQNFQSQLISYPCMGSPTHGCSTWCIVQQCLCMQVAMHGVSKGKGFSCQLQFLGFI